MATLSERQHKQRTIDKIRAANIGGRLLAFFMDWDDPSTGKKAGEWTLSAEQIRVGLGLLNKTIPDLKSIEQTIEDKRQVRTREDANDLLRNLGYSEDAIEAVWERAATNLH